MGGGALEGGRQYLFLFSDSISKKVNKKIFFLTFNKKIKHSTNDSMSIISLVLVFSPVEALTNPIRKPEMAATFFLLILVQ